MTADEGNWFQSWATTIFYLTSLFPLTGHRNVNFWMSKSEFRVKSSVARFLMFSRELSQVMRKAVAILCSLAQISHVKLRNSQERSDWNRFKCILALQSSVVRLRSDGHPVVLNRVDPICRHQASTVCRVVSVTSTACVNTCSLPTQHTHTFSCRTAPDCAVWKICAIGGGCVGCVDGELKVRRGCGVVWGWYRREEQPMVGIGGERRSLRKAPDCAVRKAA